MSEEKDVSEIIPGLWLGNITAAKNIDFLRNNNIKNIINITKNYPNYHQNEIDYLQFPYDDDDTMALDMNTIFNKSNEYIINTLKSGKSILVHCKRGHHRSASLVAAFLIKYMGFSYCDSIKYINGIRKYALRRNAAIVHKLYDFYIQTN